MFKYDELYSIHVEITNRCQASCPMCSRNYRGGIENPLLKISDWSVEDFKNIIDVETLKIIKKIEFCGNFGDPLINQDFHLMLQYIKDFDVFADIHTNGSLRNTNFWKTLPNYLPEHRVVFGIDGLEDTHSTYRIGTDFNKIIKNATAFIDAGGIAEWSFIKFKHNQHQVDEARALAEKLGFKKFYTKDSSRFTFEKDYKVLDKNEHVIETLYSPTNTKTRYFNPTNIVEVTATIQNTEIDCYAKHKKEIYIDAHKKIMPCCFLAAIPYDYERINDSLFEAKKHVKDQYKDLIHELGDTDARKGIRPVIESTPFQQVWKKYWTIKKLWICARVCGNSFSKPNDQVNKT